MESMPAAVHFLHGNYGIYHSAMLIAVEILRKGESVVIIDAANVTDPFFIANAFKQVDEDPEPFLQKGFISRCYTFYQVDVTITEGLTDFIKKVHGANLFIFGLLDLIDDEQVTVRDIHNILERVHRTFCELKKNNISTLLVTTPLHCQLKEREHFFTAFKGLSDAEYRLDSRYNHRQTKRGRDGKTDRNSNTTHRQRAGTMGKLPPRAPERSTGAFR